ncbi:hypothetical protein SLEP1_g20516 [Rubroshorea leprosula]|uniref:Uncharacterized protein n=1 Tax=Rubroshorea leprosula TaxID=152421 RepID=A0AAV5JC60_9ROSI|nr:hypothetical protein SLEP1_g20516 [Rubroshorea leprosula]
MSRITLPLPKCLPTLPKHLAHNDFHGANYCKFF